MRLQIVTHALLFLGFLVFSYSLEEDNDALLQRIQEDFAEHMKIFPHKFLPNATFKSLLTNLSIFDSSGRSVIQDITLCGICQKLIHDIQYRQLTVQYFGEALCRLYISLSTWTASTFCRDIIRINKPILKYIVDNSNILEPQYACSIFLQNEKCYYQKPPLRWKIGVTPESQKRVPQITNNPNAKPLKILHLTDVHISPDYDVGGVSNCGFPICCKKGLGNPIKSGNAGKWGDYACDIPLWLFSNALQHINHTHKDIDYVYFTGDIIDHTVWKASKKDNEELIYFTFKSLYESFPGIPVLSVLGNHEPTPLNIYAPPDPKIEQAGLSTQWLYDLIAKLWRGWLPSEALKTVQKQGYYTYTISDKLKVIALNNNICYIYNWWLMLDTTFLAEQLKFLQSELQDSEKKEQFVHIIAHVPPGNKECIEPWEKNYNAIIRRYAHIVKGQFFGHTHTDELKVFYDTKSNPVNVGFNGASLTPYQKYNPNYKIITIDTNTYEVRDIDTYIFNLTEANANPDKTPRWFKFYSMKETFGLSNFSAQSFGSLANKLFRDDQLSDLYWRLYVRDGDASLKEGCNANCKREILCKIVTTELLVTNKDECK